jgi:nucleotide-binding universal stress UspA family protein
MSSILCGTDFSPQAREAARVAAAWAARTGHELCLMHVWDAWLADDPLFALQAQALEQLGKMLEDEAGLLRAEFRASVSTRLRSGIVYEAMLREAVACDASLIVVASLGRGQRHGWLLGSNAERVAQRSAVPVLVVRDAPPLLAWLAGTRNLVVSVCVDLTEASQAALRWARNLHRLGDCALELDYVAWPPAEPRFAAQRSAQAQTGDWSGLEAGLAADVALWASATEHSTDRETTRAVVNWGRPDAALVELARAAGSTLIVAGSHRRSHIARLWQGSVTRGLLHGADANVVCVPPRVAEHADRTDVTQ